MEFNMKVEAYIEKGFCTSCGVCWETYNEIFIEDSDGTSNINEKYRSNRAFTLEGDLAKKAISAAEECPAGAIVVR
ncbi:MAG: ferredoxin [Aquificota bacterium]|nr:MAG: ferredoxin [Aquificota bacterium]